MITLFIAVGLIAADVPPFFQPPTDFYGAKGTHVTITATSDLTRVPVNKLITFTITVHGTGTQSDLKRPPLRDLPEFSRRFEIEDVPSSNPAVFEYHLRPRTTEIDRIPRLRFAYYNPTAAEGKQFPVTYTDAIPIRVLPPVEDVNPKSPMQVPAIFREPSAARSWEMPAGLDSLAWMSAAIMGLTAGFVAWWRWRNPDGPRLARVRQTRAVRRVLGRLSSANEPADVAEAMHGYLVERFGITIPSAAPCDVQAALTAVGFDERKTLEVVNLVRRCDAARFGDGSDAPSSLAVAGKTLVHQWEGLPC